MARGHWNCEKMVGNGTHDSTIRQRCLGCVHVTCDKFDNRWYVLNTGYWFETGLPAAIVTSILNNVSVYTTLWCHTASIWPYQLLSYLTSDRRSEPSPYLLVVIAAKDGSKVITVLATEGHGPDTSRQVSYTDTKVIGNGSFGVVYQAKLCESSDLVAIKKVLQDKRFKVLCVFLCFW